jgi:3-oxoadipate enol-lactonase
VKLHHVLDGSADAPALFLSSSLGTTLAMWEPQIARLAERFRVIRCDRRGHGRSPVAAGMTTIDDLGGDLLELLDDLALERVSICGLSLGGVEGMWLAVNAPERVERLALCCTAPSFPPRQGWVDRAAVVRADGLEAIADAVLGRWFRPSFHDTHPDVVAHFRAMLVAIPRDGYAACCDALADVDLTPRLAEIAAPTFVVTGSDDPVVTPTAGDALAAGIPGAVHTVIDDAAHIANVEQPEAFTGALLRHLGEGGEDK